MMSDDRKLRAPGDESRKRPPSDPFEALTAFAGEEPDLPLEKLDPDALKVIHRLRAHGHQAYLVGGCVRDLSLGIQPKDFDVATSAHPGEIRAIFRNCRLIGRRFRLAHVYFRGGKVVETATFRANPNADPSASAAANGDLLILRDNVFGTAEEDARRRDFTINGLFYDVVLGRILDYVGGLEDVERRRIRTIGDPDVRMREDPVRLLRAVRFAAKLDCEIDPETWAAMERNKGEIARCSPPRVLEEIFRLLRTGYSRRSFELLHQLGALEVLLPPVASWLERAGAEEGQALFTSLGLLDEVVRKGICPDDSILLSTLLIHHSQHQLVKDAPAPEAHANGEEEAGLGEGEDEETEVEEMQALEEATDEAVPLPEDDPGEAHLAEEAPEDLPQVEWQISAQAESVEELLAELVRSARLPRRIAERARLILHAQRVLSGVRKRRSSPMKFVRQPYFPAALLVLELYAKASGHGLDALERWRERYQQWLADGRGGTAASDDPAAAILAAESAPARTDEPNGAETPEAEADQPRRKRRGGRRKGGREAAGGGANEAPVAAASEEKLPPPEERGPPPGPADFLPF